MTYNNPIPVAVAAVRIAEGVFRYFPTFVQRCETLEAAAQRAAEPALSSMEALPTWRLVRSVTVGNRAFTLCEQVGAPAPTGVDFMAEALTRLTSEPAGGPTPVAVALVPLTGGETATLLGVVRNIPPGLGGTALPGGYVDEGESFEIGACRETFEECGLPTRPDEWRLVCSRATAENRLLVFCEHVSRPHVGPNGEQEVRGVVPFDAREVAALTAIGLQTPIVFPTHQEVARAFLERAAA